MIVQERQHDLRVCELHLHALHWICVLEETAIESVTEVVLGKGDLSNVHVHRRMHHVLPLALRFRGLVDEVHNADAETGIWKVREWGSIRDRSRALNNLKRRVSKPRHSCCESCIPTKAQAPDRTEREFSTRIEICGRECTHTNIR